MPEMVIKRGAARVLRRMDVKTRARVVAALDILAADPESGEVDVRPLAGTEGFRLRVGDWRVLFDRLTVTEKNPESGEAREVDTIVIQAIRPRGDAYKKRR